MNKLTLLAMADKKLSEAANVFEELRREVEKEISDVIEEYLNDKEDFNFRFLKLNADTVEVRYYYEDRFTYNFVDDTIYFNESYLTINATVLFKLIEIIKNKLGSE